MHYLELVARSITSLQGVFIACALIGGWAVIAYLRFRSRIIPYYRELKGLCRTLESFGGEEDFSAKIETLDTEARATDLMRHAWSEFRETLVDPAIDDTEEILYNTQSARVFFSQDSLLGERVNVRLYNALPNLLTGAGILGTFIGLVAGIFLAGSSLSDPLKAQAALSDLLGGASLAFLTSIVGLMSSIVFSSLEKTQIHGFERYRKRWVDGLDKRLRLISLERIAQDSLSQHRQQTEFLGEFTEKLVFQLTDALEQTVPRALEEKVAAPLSDALARLQNVMEGIAQNQAKTNEDTLREIVDTFSQSISGAAGDEMREFANAVQVMSSQLQGQIQAVSTQQEEMHNQSEESARKLAEVFQAGANALQAQVSASVNEVLDGLGATVSKMAELLDSTVSRMAQQLDRTAASFGETVGTLNSSVDEIRKILDSANQLMGYLDQLIAGTRKAHNELDRIAKSFESSSRSMDAITERSSDSVRLIQQSTKELSEGAAKLEAMQGAIQQVWSDYQSRFESVDESLGRAFTEMDDGIQRHTRSIREFVQELDQHTSGITSKLAGAVKDLEEGIDELNEVLGRVHT